MAMSRLRGATSFTRWPSMPSLTTRVSSAFMLTVSRLMRRSRLMKDREISTETGIVSRMMSVSSQDIYRSTTIMAITTSDSRTTTVRTSVA